MGLPTIIDDISTLKSSFKGAWMFRLFLSIGVLLCPLILLAQEPPTRFSISAQVGAVITEGQVNTHQVRDVGGGFSATLQVPLSKPFHLVGIAEPSLVSSRTNDNMLALTRFMAGIGLSVERGDFRPYAEILGGFNSQEFIGDDTPNVANTTYSWTVGVRAGTQWMFSERIGGDVSVAVNRLHFDAGSSRLINLNIGMVGRFR